MADRFTLRTVVGILGAIALLGVAGMFWLAHDGIDIPEALNSLTSGAVGAVAALLARTSVDPEPEQEPKPPVVVIDTTPDPLDA
jgi:hypothetical protein